MGSNRKSVEPDIFSGNVLEFADWEVDLDDYLRTEGIKGQSRLRHLKKYLQGDAKTCIEGHFSTNTNEAYLAARATLKERYGNEQNIARRFREKLDNWPKLAPKDGKAIREYSDFLGHLESARSRFKTLKILDDCVENERMVGKLPAWMKIKWGNVIAKVQESKDRYPTFDEFSKFIKAEAHVMTLPIFQTITSPDKEPERSRRPPQRNIRSYQTSTEPRKECRHCSLSNHTKADCYRIQERSKEDKEEFIKKNGLCYRCFEHGHRSKNCESKLKCLTCKKSHATANHDPNFKPYNDRFKTQGIRLNKNLTLKKAHPAQYRKQPTQDRNRRHTQHNNSIKTITKKQEIPPTQPNAIARPLHSKTT